MSAPSTQKVGITLAVIQLFFTLMWTVYVIFLPQLASQVGIARESVLVILMMDQLIFLVADTAMGIVADKVVKVFGKVSRWVVLFTAASCLAFLVMPMVATHGEGAKALFLVLTVVWSITSSALRAPPLVLLGKYAKLPAIPWLASFSFFGVGIAGAMAPYLTVHLRGLDPRWPFALSSLALLLATFGIAWAERSLKKDAVAAPVAAPASEEPALRKSPIPPFLIAIALLAIGFQVHSSINSTPQYLRFAKPADLEILLPIFWVGFNVLMLCASPLTKKYGGVLVMGVAGCVGAVAAGVAAFAPSLDVLVVAQFVTGGAWGVLMMSAFTAALLIGRTGREGLVTGGMFSLLALAAFLRMLVVAGQLNRDPLFMSAFSWLPTLSWLAAFGVLLHILKKHATPVESALT